MCAYAASHFQPKPKLPGFKWYRNPDEDDQQGNYSFMPVTWEVVEQEICCGNGACSAAVCQENPNFPVGVLSDMDHQIISTHLDCKGNCYIELNQV